MKMSDQQEICPSNQAHGPMVQRQNSDHNWCGTWYDCQYFRCYSSRLLPNSARLFPSDAGPATAQERKAEGEKGSEE